MSYDIEIITKRTITQNKMSHAIHFIMHAFVLWLIIIKFVDNELLSNQLEITLDLKENYVSSRERRQITFR